MGMYSELENTAIESFNDVLEYFKPLEFNEEIHQYKLNGTILPSASKVVSAFKPAFDPDGSILRRCAKREKISPEELRAQWDDKARRASKQGTDVHRAIESIILGENPPHQLDPKHAHFTKTAEEASAWIMNDERFKILGAEVRMFNTRWNLAGTTDLIVWDRMAGEFAIMDWKTSKSIDYVGYNYAKMHTPFQNFNDVNHSHYSLQMAIYAQFLRDALYHLGYTENNWELPMKSYILHLRPDKFDPMRDVIQTKDIPNKLVISALDQFSGEAW